MPGMDVVDVWVEAGREGRAFTYVDRQRLGLAAGDLVQVYLRGRPMQGLVIACRALQDDCEEAALQPVNRLVQRAAVDPSWRSWLDAMAHRCHTMRSRRDLIGQRPHRAEVEGLGHRRELVDIAGAGFEVHPEALLDPNHEGQRVILFVLVHGLPEDDTCELSLKLMNDQGAGMVVDTINKLAERARARLTDLDGLLQDAGWRKARPRTSADRMA